MNKNQAANAPDYSSLTLKRDKHSENCEEIISSKHLKVKILNLDFSSQFLHQESKNLSNALYTDIF